MIPQTLSRIASLNVHIPWMACLALGIFLSFFVCMLVWVFQRENQEVHRRMSRMPLNDEVKS